MLKRLKCLWLVSCSAALEKLLEWRHMATRARQRNGTLEAAMAMLLQNQAALAKQYIEFLDRSEKRNAEMEQRFAAVMKELDLIKSVLARHEKILESLPEAIRQKIGFKSQ